MDIKSLLAEREFEFHEAIIKTLKDGVKFLHEVVFDGKADTGVKTLCTTATTPEEGVAATNLVELGSVGEASFTEDCDLDFIASELSIHESCSALWST